MHLNLLFLFFFFGVGTTNESMHTDSSQEMRIQNDFAYHETATYRSF